MKLTILILFTTLFYIYTRKTHKRTKEVRNLNEICEPKDGYTCQKGLECEKWGKQKYCKALTYNPCQKNEDCLDYILAENPYSVRCELDTKTCQPLLKKLNQNCTHKIFGSECMSPNVCDKNLHKCMAGYNAPCGSHLDCANGRKCELSGLLTVKKVCVGFEFD